MSLLCVQPPHQPCTRDTVEKQPVAHKSNIWLDGITFLIVNEIARHVVTAMALVAGIHLLAAFIEWISNITGTSVMNLPIVWDFQLKQLLLTIDAVLIAKLAYEGYIDIHRIYDDARSHKPPQG